MIEIEGYESDNEASKVNTSEEVNDEADKDEEIEETEETEAKAEETAETDAEAENKETAEEKTEEEKEETADEAKSGDAEPSNEEPAAEEAKEEKAEESESENVEAEAEEAKPEEPAAEPEKPEEKKPEKKERGLKWAKGNKAKKESEEDKLRAQAAEANDKYIRLFAEFDNFRNRTEKEKTQRYDMGARDVVEKILPVIDNFERGFAAVEEADREDAFVKGMDLVYKQFEKVLEDIGVKPIEAVGQPFNPDLHNAVMHVDDPEVGENIVVEEFQKGYMYKDQVVRYSMVKVAN